jgi:glycosyltransferase involved in cell wall biosynthesis
MPVDRVAPVIMVGPLPPPVHGASVMTAAIADLLTDSGLAPIRCSTSPKARSRGWRWHLSRITAYLVAARTILFGPRDRVVYLSLSGGNGLAYDTVIALAARLAGHRLVLHHHSFDYVDRKRLLFAALLRAAPRDHVHVVLCDAMADGLQQRYGRPIRAITVSNAGFLPPASTAASPRRRPLRRIGFLSNLSAEKGLDRFLDLAAHFAARRDLPCDLAFELAGPCADDGARQMIEAKLAAGVNLHHHGPLFGADKAAFYDRIDAFVFLSRYANEAEPLVVYEAMAAGLPVITTMRGCLCEMLRDTGATLLDRTGSDIGTAVRQIESWVADPERHAAASAAVLARLAGLRAEANAQRTALIAAFDRARPAVAAIAAAAG